VVIAGLTLLAAGTVVFAGVGPDTSYWLIGGGLVLRGLGLGCALMPAMAAAYATLDRNQVPRATPALNVLQRVGGSIGAAALIVVLQNRIVETIGAGAGSGVSGADLSESARTRIAQPLADAFAHTFSFALILSLIAFVPASVLVWQEAKVRRSERARVADEAAAAESRRAVDETRTSVAVG
jgi:hypothetical protein